MKTALPNGWKKVELNNVTVCLDEKRIPLNSEDRSKMKGNIPYYGANCQIDSINKHIFNEELLLLAEDGGSWGPHQNCSYIISGKSWVNNHAHVLKMKKGMDISYLMYFLNHHDLNRFISGTTRGKLNQGVMKKMPIVLPPLHVQKQIVSTLEKVEKVKGMRKEADELTKDFLNAIFLKMFGDPIKNKKKWKTSTIGNNLKDMKYGTSSPPKYGENGVKFIRATNIKEGRIVENGILLINKDEAEKIEKCKLVENDLIIVRSGVNTGDCAIITDMYSGSYGGYDIIFHPDNRMLNSTFLNELLNLDSSKLILKQLSRRAGQPHLNSKQVSDFEVILPPIDLQNKFANIVKKIEDMKKYQRESKEHISNLFNNLMQKSFNGELIC